MPPKRPVIPAHRGQDRYHRVQPILRILGFNEGISAAPYIYNDGTSTVPLCTGPVRQCAGWGNLYGGLEPAQTFFSMATQLPIATKAGLPNYNKKYDNGTTADKTLDSLRGKSEAEARQTLESKGYVVKTSRVIGGNVPYGRVVRAITGKDGKKKGAEITLQLSDGAGASQSLPPAWPTPTPPAHKIAPAAVMPTVLRARAARLAAQAAEGATAVAVPAAGSRRKTLASAKRISIALPTMSAASLAAKPRPLRSVLAQLGLDLSGQALAICLAGGLGIGHLHYYTHLLHGGCRFRPQPPR